MSFLYLVVGKVVTDGKLSSGAPSHVTLCVQVRGDVRQDGLTPGGDDNAGV